ncbi:S49 family peptidase [Spirosoma lacussanchae]|nr:S49 family peptidase [Spirosoma lacussanchae]
MNAVNIAGLWCLEESFAMRMWGIVEPRLKAGKEPFAPAMVAGHPARTIQATLQTAGKSILAGTIEYYQYVVNAYTVEGVCVIPVMGTLTRYGLCSWGYEDLAGLLAVADGQESVKAVVLRIDSPGGAVDGVKVLADAVRAVKKPVVVWTNFCASAAYFVASQAREIWVEEQTLYAVGSIGTLMVYTDQSEALKKAGLKVEIMRASESTDKSRMNGTEPLPDETRAEIQGILDASQKEFAGYVRRGRAGLLTSDEWKTAKMYGVRDAIRIGLADQKGTLRQAIQRAAQLAA